MAKIVYYSQKIDGEHSTDERNQQIYDDFIEGQKDGCIEHTARRAVKPKSPKQTKTIFGLMINDTIAQANDLGIDVSYFLKYLVDDSIPKGQGLTIDFLHELMYVICPTTDENGRRKTLSQMSTIEASNLFERFRAIVAPMGIDILDPDPNYKQIKI